MSNEKFKEAQKQAIEILESANKQAVELILNNKDITSTQSVKEISEAVGKINELSSKHRLFADTHRMDFICNRIDNTDGNVAEIKDSIKGILEKLDGYPLIKSIVIGACAFILLSFLGGLTYLVFKSHV